MKLPKFVSYFILSFFLIVLIAPNSFAKKGKVSKKRCDKAIERIFELTMQDVQKKQKEISEDQMKIIRERWKESSPQLVEQCQEKASKEGIECVMQAKKIEDATKCPD